MGLIVGTIIGISSDYFTNDEKNPFKNAAKASESGPAFTILYGVSYGFLSTLPALVGIGISSLAAYKLCEPIGEGYAMFGIAIAAVGMLSIVGMIISNYAYGPIVDNARGLAQMAISAKRCLKSLIRLTARETRLKRLLKALRSARRDLYYRAIKVSNLIARHINIFCDFTNLFWKLLDIYQGL